MFWKMPPRIVRDLRPLKIWEKRPGFGGGVVTIASKFERFKMEAIELFISDTSGTFRGMD